MPIALDNVWKNFDAHSFTSTLLLWVATASLTTKLANQPSFCSVRSHGFQGPSSLNFSFDNLHGINNMALPKTSLNLPVLPPSLVWAHLCALVPQMPLQPLEH